MDTHSKVAIVIGNDNNHETLKPLKFFDSLQSIDFNRDISRIKEYTHFKLRINGEESIKVYSDLFELYDDPKIQVDEDNRNYMGNGEIDIVDSDIANNLVPGYYLLTLKEEDYKYAVIEIVPKDVSNVEWKTIYQDVNNYIKGLSNSLYHKNNSSISPTVRNNNIVEKIDYLEVNFTHIIFALKNIYDSPRYQVQKRYAWRPIYTQPKVDKNTLKYRSKRPDKTEELYSYNKELNYNLKENIWLKKVLKFLQYELVEIKDYLNLAEEIHLGHKTSRYSSDVLIATKSLENIWTIRENINRIQHMLQMIIESEWYQNIENKSHASITHSALMDNKYNIIYKWYSEFNKSSLEFVFSQKVKNCWKRTDELYEIWCFINVLELLIRNDFDPIDGWIFDDYSYNDLPDNTVITLNKNDIRLKLHFNSIIKSERSQTTKEHPLYTGDKKNKPDIRIDIHVNNIYIKSIPMDVKYRKLKNITKKEKGSLEQLLAYWAHPKSNLHLEGAKVFRRRNHRIISKVAVLYPKDHSNNNKTDKLAIDHNLHFFEFSPSYKDDDFTNMINEEIDEAYEIYEDIYGF
ncbi:DUF2357 domain-containing protein [Staphylococcus chromogenes]|uniref:DUF2357 domain-containing protein n=2 Tax=Staphylococcus chromogenes TaxID=46126 RepID=UPI000E698BE6|nr:DUF2357 domain-containing protein [Staphylococcus chromogenes]RIM12746.1 DUF2357 domain-containing protein [Staphylococcus chromogenes]